MSRMDQTIGLNERAKKYLSDFENKGAYSSYETAWSGYFPLYRYEKLVEDFDSTHISGAVEYVQCAPWASGPCFFLALCGVNGPIKESLWTEDEIEALL